MDPGPTEITALTGTEMSAAARRSSGMRARLTRRRGGDPSEARGERHVFRTAHALMLNTVLSGALGFGFWILAARLYSAESVGVNSALIAVMVTVSTLSQVNLGSVFTRFLPESGHPASFILRGYVVAGAISLLVATLVAVIAPRFAPDLSVLRSHHLITVIWILAVALWSVFSLQDAALSALRFARWIPVENTVFGVLKIATLVVLAAVGAHLGMLVAWVLPMAILVLPVNLLIFGRAVPAHEPAHDEGIVTRFGRRRLYNYLGMTGLAATVDQGVLAALPIVVVAILGATQNAYFYIAFTIVFSLEILGDNMSTALTIEGSFAVQQLRELAVAVIRRVVFVLMPATLAVILAAPLVLLFFGRDYADHGTTLLRLLALGTIFRAGTWVYLAVCRVQGRGHAVLAISAATSAGTLALVIAFAQLWGLNGVGLAVLIVNVAVAAVVVPQLVRFLRRPAAPSGSGGAPSGTTIGPDSAQATHDAPAGSSQSRRPAAEPPIPGNGLSRDVGPAHTTVARSDARAGDVGLARYVRTVRHALARVDR